MSCFIGAGIALGEGRPPNAVTHQPASERGGSDDKKILVQVELGAARPHLSLDEAFVAARDSLLPAVDLPLLVVTRLLPRTHTAVLLGGWFMLQDAACGSKKILRK